MKLVKILEKLNSFEKNSFIKILDSIISNNPNNSKEIDKILVNTDSNLKNLDNIIISKILALIEDEFCKMINNEFVKISSQLDILIDIIIRNGNCIMKYDWFSKLYDTELKKIKNKTKILQNEMVNPKSELSEKRKRDYKIYKACVATAYTNDIKNNRDAIITDDELSILLTLSHELELSQEEVKLINYMVLGVNKAELDTLINDLKNIGVIFFNKKTNTIFIADEIVRVLRKIRKKEIADKFLRRILKLSKESQINLICKNYNIDRKLNLETKIKEIINEGISFTGLLSTGFYKENTTLTDKKNFLNNLWYKNLNISLPLKGSTLENKIKNLISYFEEIEKDEKVGISVDGYEKLLVDLGETLPKLNNQVRTEFELQDEKVLLSKLLLDYNIKPRDILDIISPKDIEKFCLTKNIKTRGNCFENILNTYKDSENLYLENYVPIGFRNKKTLEENGLKVKESCLGLKFEELTKVIFSQLGFNVDEKLRKELNTQKDKMDILLNLGNNELILIECKTIKDNGYNKFSTVLRQLKSYQRLAKDNGYKVIKSLLIAPDFSEEFIKATDNEFSLNLSLITASSLIKILDGYKKNKKHKKFPYMLLMRDVLIQEDRIIKAIER